MADTTDDAQVDAGKTGLSFQEQMAAIKQNSSEAEDDSSAADSGAEDSDEQADKGAEANGASSGDGGDEGSDDSGQDGGSGDDEAEPGADSGKDGQQFEGRFSQFKGDGTADTYVKNLEDGYTNSSQEAIRLKGERDSFERQVSAIKDAAATDKEFGARLLGLLNGNGNDAASTASGTKKANDFANPAAGDSDNPFLKDAETSWNKESVAEAEKFAEANPEVLTDPKLNEDVKRYMRIFSNDIYEREGRLIKAGEAMKMAYRTLGLEDKSETQGNLVAGLKQNAAPTRPPASKSKAAASSAKGSKQFSDLTLNIASKMNISKERLEKGRKR